MASTVVGLAFDGSVTADRRATQCPPHRIPGDPQSSGLKGNETNDCSTVQTSRTYHVLIDDLASYIALSNEQVQQEDCIMMTKKLTVIIAKSSSTTVPNGEDEYMPKAISQNDSAPMYSLQSPSVFG